MRFHRAGPHLVAMMITVVPCTVSAQTDPAAAGVTVRGRVIDAVTSLPLPAVTVVVTAGRDTLARAKSDTSGGFVLAAMRTASATITAHFARESYHADSLSAELETTARLPLRVAMIPTSMKAYAGKANPGPLTGPADFDRRAAHHGTGTFFTPADIERRSPLQTSDLLRGLPGLRLDDSSGVVLVSSSRGAQASFAMSSTPSSSSAAPASPAPAGSGRSGAPAAPAPAPAPTTPTAATQRCPIRVGVDGRLMDPTFSVDDIAVNMVHGIELYLGASTVPIQFSITGPSAPCGLIMIWTRTGNESVH